MDRLFFNVTNWSNETFGAERGPIGPLKHLREEVDEAIAEPDDILEYADCLILIFDAAQRAGFNYYDLAAAGHTKMNINRKRTYLKVPEGEVSRHIKLKE